MPDDDDEAWIDPRSILPEPMPDNEWRHLIAAERQLAEALQAVGRGETEGDRRELSRQWWSSVAEIMSELHWRSRAGIAITDPPADLYRTLSLIAGSLAVGTIPEPVSDVASAGKPAIGPLEANHIAFAVAYLKLAAAGRIKDRFATATVAKCYDVKRQTVLGWKSRNLTREVYALMDHPSLIKDNIIYVGTLYAQQQRRWTIGKLSVDL